MNLKVCPQEDKCQGEEALRQSLQGEPEGALQAQVAQIQSSVKAVVEAEVLRVKPEGKEGWKAKCSLS